MAQPRPQVLSLILDYAVLTLNGSNMPIAFVGLTPAFVGLYQITFQIPTDAPNGNLVPVVSQSGVASNATLPIHN